MRLPCELGVCLIATGWVELTFGNLALKDILFVMLLTSAWFPTS